MELIKKNIMLFFLLLSFSHCFAQSSREDKLIKLIDVEVSTIEKVKKIGEHLKYRLFELYSEKTKLLRIRENEALVKSAIANSDKNAKNQFFKDSDLLFQKSMVIADDLLKNYPSSKYTSQIYYGKASNLIEIRNSVEADEEKIISWLTLSVEKARSAEKKYLAEVKLAEIYYSVKKYPEAKKMYTTVIKNNTDQWYTKNLYNLAWCEFQLKNYDIAVKLALQSYKASKNKKYENMEDQVGDALDYFYVFMKFPEEGLNFHEQNTKDRKRLMTHFMKILELSKKFISSSVALKAQDTAVKYCTAALDHSCLLHVGNFKLEILRENKDYHSHRVLTHELALNKQNLGEKASEEDLNTLGLIINNVADLVTTVQQLFYKGHFLFNSKDETFSEIISYYNDLKILNPSFLHEYAYLQGEVSYKNNNLAFASKFYLESHGFAVSSKNKSNTPQFMNKLFKSMLALANDPALQDNNFFEYTHVNYLVYYPKDETSVPIYEGLFKFYQTQKKSTQAERLVQSFHEKMPEKLPLQQEMIKVILSKLIESRLIEDFNTWIARLQAGQFKFNSQFIDQNVKILAQLLFERAQQLELKGNYVAAINEYEAIVKRKSYPLEIRSDSMLNMSVNYLKLLKGKLTLKWFKLSLKEKSEQGLAPKIKIYESIASDLLLQQSLEESLWVQDYLLNNHCAKLSSPDNSLMVYAKTLMATNSDLSPSGLSFSQCTVQVETTNKVRQLILREWVQKASIVDIKKNIDPLNKSEVDLVSKVLSDKMWNMPFNTEAFNEVKERLKEFFAFASLPSSDLRVQQLTFLETRKEKKQSRIPPFEGNLAQLQKLLDAQLKYLDTQKSEISKTINTYKDERVSQLLLLDFSSDLKNLNEEINRSVVSNATVEDKNQWTEIKNGISQGLKVQQGIIQKDLSRASKGSIFMRNREISSEADNYLKSLDEEFSYKIYYKGVENAPK